MDLDFVSVHKHAKKELDQYSPILTSHLVNNPIYIAPMNQLDSCSNTEDRLAGGARNRRLNLPSPYTFCASFSLSRHKIISPSMPISFSLLPAFPFLSPPNFFQALPPYSVPPHPKTLELKLVRVSNVKRLC